MTGVRVKVIPGAREDAIMGWQDNVLRVRVRAKLERGKANEAVCRLLARALNVPRSSVSIVTGVASREKLIVVDGMDEEEIRRRLTVVIP